MTWPALMTPALLVAWEDVVRLTPAQGAPGIGYTRGRRTGCEVLLYRDAAGVLRGALAVDARGEALLMVEPQSQRGGIGLALLAEAHRRGIRIPFDRQTYTAAGWRCVCRHLERIGRAACPWRLTGRSGRA